MSPERTGVKPNRFLWVSYLLVVLLVAYPYFPDTDMGSLAGGLMALIVIVAALRAAHHERRVFYLGLALAVVVMAGLAAGDRIVATGIHKVDSGALVRAPALPGALAPEIDGAPGFRECAGHGGVPEREPILQC